MGATLNQSHRCIQDNTQLNFHFPAESCHLQSKGTVQRGIFMVPQVIITVLSLTCLAVVVLHTWQRSTFEQSMVVECHSCSLLFLLEAATSPRAGEASGVGADNNWHVIVFLPEYGSERNDWEQPQPRVHYPQCPQGGHFDVPNPVPASRFPTPPHSAPHVNMYKQGWAGVQMN